MMSEFIELCAGTGTVSAYLVGQGRGVTPYMGAKTRHRKALAQALSVRPTAVTMVDAGEWGRSPST